MTVTKIIGAILLFPFCALADLATFALSHSSLKDPGFQSFTHMLLEAVLDPSK